ncbi:hypothetical protein [Actinokineospora sp.]|uniref:hypothetical protein n=1 Tax=Actinokineospora sp. TaxID=1872133 RepID=UPI003D6B9203
MTNPNREDDTVTAALDQAQRWLDTIPGVTAVGQGDHDGHPTVDVWVTDPEWAADLPTEVRGIEVRVRDAGGPITAQPPRADTPGDHPTTSR